MKTNIESEWLHSRPFNIKKSIFSPSSVLFTFTFPFCFLFLPQVLVCIYVLGCINYSYFKHTLTYVHCNIRLYLNLLSVIFLFSFFSGSRMNHWKCETNSFYIYRLLSLLLVKKITVIILLFTILKYVDIILFTEFFSVYNFVWGELNR